MSGQGIFLLALLISGVAGLLFSALHGLASIHFNANQAISGIALNIAAPALAIFVARLLIGRQQVSFSNTYRIAAVPVLSAGSYTHLKNSVLNLIFRHSGLYGL